MFKMKLDGVKLAGSTTIVPIEETTVEAFSSTMVSWVKKHIYWVLPMSGMMLGGGGAAWYMTPSGDVVRPPVVQQVQPSGVGQPMYVPCQPMIPCQPVVACQQPACQPKETPVADSETNRLLKSLIDKIDAEKKAPTPVPTPTPTVTEPPIRRPAPPAPVRQDSCPCPPKTQTRESERQPVSLTAAEQKQYDLWAPLNKRRQ